jgi:prepilin-type N-terminal cleavage/methylation domain-containing protein
MKRKNGFTLLELLVVMTLITLILSISAISFVNSLPAGRFHATVRELSATIRHAGHLYRQSGRKQVVSINIESGKYGIVGRGEKDIPKGINVKVIDPLEEEIYEGTFKIVFSISEGPGGEKIVLWDEKREAQVSVDPVVGAVVVKRSSS